MFVKSSRNLVVHLAKIVGYDQSCRRFLSLRVENGGHVPYDARVVSAAAAARPFVLGQPESPATQAVQQLAVSLADQSRDVLPRRA